MNRQAIYSTPGLLEFRMRRQVGGATMIIDFGEGRSVGNTTRWGRFMTGDPVVRHIIETSPEYLRGRVVKVWSHDEGERSMRKTRER